MENLLETFIPSCLGQAESCGQVRELRSAAVSLRWQRVAQILQCPLPVRFEQAGHILGAVETGH